MRIGLNLLHAQPEIGGGWYYIENLVSALGKYGQLNEYIAFVTSQSECLVPKNSNIVPVHVSIRATSRPQRVFFENTVLQFLARKFKLDCMHWFANTQAIVNMVPSVVTVYDLHLYHNVTRFSPVKRLYLRLMISSAVRRAAVLLPMSHATAMDLQAIMHADPSRMTVIPAVLNNLFLPADDAAVLNFRVRFVLPVKFWLYVAHFYPHKNHINLLLAYSKMKQSGFKPWPLVFRGDPHGSESLIMDTIKQYHLGDDVLFISEMTNVELPLLYSAASALIFPSLFEGGGMPVSEAMACGCPVVASAIPAVKESAGDAALYFDPYDLSSIAQIMLNFQSDASLWETLRQRGLVMAGNSRPEHVVKRLLGAYSRAALRNRS